MFFLKEMRPKYKINSQICMLFSFSCTIYILRFDRVFIAKLKKYLFTELLGGG